MIVADDRIESLLSKLVQVKHIQFQESISESNVIASDCYVLALGDDKTTISQKPDLVYEMLHDIALTFLSRYRKHLTTPKGGQYTLYDKFTSGPARSMVESMFQPKAGLDPSCFCSAQQITLYVALKHSFTGQSSCVRAILNSTGDGLPSNRGALLMRTVIPN